MEEAVLLEIIKVGGPLLIELLEKYGFFSAAQAFEAKTAEELYVDIKSLKTYQEFPSENSKGQIDAGQS